MVHVVANAEAKKEFVLPVSWQVFGKIKVQANTLAEAFDWAQEHLDEIPLDDDTDYVDGSYEISAESPEECELYNSSKILAQFRAINIKWDVDEDEDGNYLPTTVILPEELNTTDGDAIGDWLSNEYGFCHDGFSLISVSNENLIKEEESLKRAIADAGVDAVEDFLGHPLDCEGIDIWAEMNDAVAQMPNEEYIKYLQKYNLI